MRVLRRAKPLLGTIIEISVWSESEELSHNAISDAFLEIEQVQNLLSIHNAKSEVSKLNSLKKGVIAKIHPFTYEILKSARALFDATDGIFDVVRSKDSTNPTSMEDINFLDQQQISFECELQMDFGGIGKGFAVDKAIETLIANGIEDGIVSAGGDLRTFGDMKHSVYLRNPKNPYEIKKALEIQNQSLATSANYFRNEGTSCDLDDGIVNPITGETWRAIDSISVAAPTCTQADALTKIVALLGQAAKATLEKNSAIAFTYDGIESCPI